MKGLTLGLFLGVVISLVASEASEDRKVKNPADLLIEGLSKTQSKRELQEDCPFPLLPATPENTNFIDVSANVAFAGFSCGFRCTGTMVDQEGLESYDVITKVVSGFGLFLSAFIFLTWGMFSIKSRQKMTFWVAFASVGVTSTIFFPIIIKGEGEKVWCEDDLEPIRQTDGMSSCVLQGMSIVFFGLVLCCWWWCSCVDLFAKLYLRKRNTVGYLRYYHMFSWTLPTLATAIILFTGKFGYEQPRLWCFFSPDAPDSYEFVFFYGWVAFLWFSGTIMMVMVIYSVVAHSRSYKRGRNGAGRTNYFKKLALYRTPLVFVFLFSIFWAIFFSFVLITQIDKKDYESSATSWIACLYLGVITGVDSPHNTFSAGVAQLDPQPAAGTVGCGDVQPGRIPPGLLLTAVLALAGNGILIFLVFGLQVENFKLWKKWLGSGCDPSSVRPRVAQQDEFQPLPMSTFQELRVGLAKMNIYVCEAFAGLDHTHTSGHKASANKTARPILDANDPTYTPKFVDDSILMVSPLAQTTANAAAYPRVSYENRNPSVDAQDPFPTRNSSPPPAELQQFYTPQPARQIPVAQRNTAMSGWSEIYNDPLWGVNIEF